MSGRPRRQRETGRLAPVAVTILESLYQHRLLSTVQLHQLHTPHASMRWAQWVLESLRRAQLAAVTRRPHGLGLWYLTERGTEAVETIANRAEPRRKLIRSEQAAGPLQAHTLAVNDAAITFVKAARERGDECGPFAWRHEIAHPLGPPPGRRRQPEHLIADALLRYQLNTADGAAQFHARFLELDRATIPLEELSVKLARYARLYTYEVPPEPGAEPVPLWRLSYPAFPGVLVVLDGTPARPALERRRSTLLALCRDDDELLETPEVAITVCLLEDLTRRGPFAPIFRTLADPQTPADWLGQPPERR
jgi:hypothetical protein